MIYFSIAHLLESFGPRYFHCLGFIGLCRKVFGAFSQLEFWKGEIREEGRKALKDTEDKIRFIVQTTGMPKQDVDGAEERRVAKEATRKAREALESS